MRAAISREITVRMSSAFLAIFCFIGAAIAENNPANNDGKNTGANVGEPKTTTGKLGKNTADTTAHTGTNQDAGIRVTKEQPKSATQSAPHEAAPALPSTKLPSAPQLLDQPGLPHKDVDSDVNKLKQGATNTQGTNERNRVAIGNVTDPTLSDTFNTSSASRDTADSGLNEVP